MKTKRYSDCVIPGWVVMVRESLTKDEKAGVTGFRIQHSESVVNLVGPRIRSEVVEVMYCIGLDGRNRVSFMQEVSRGGLHMCAVTARDVYRVAAATSASAIIMVHNHPSGDPTPSPEDYEFTRKIKKAGDVLGIPLIDHVVIAELGHSSFLDSGFLARM